jgi:hypothetical protein
MVTRGRGMSGNRIRCGSTDQSDPLGPPLDQTELGSYPVGVDQAADSAKADRLAMSLRRWVSAMPIMEDPEPTVDWVF